MAVAIDFEDMTETLKEEISSKYVLQTKENLYSDVSTLSFFQVDDKRQKVWVPLGVWSDLYEEFPTVKRFAKISVQSKKKLFSLGTDPKGTRDQDVVFKEAYNLLLKHHTVFVAAFPGFGKTSLTNVMISAIGLPTLVICYSTTVLDQWEDELKKFSTAKVWRVKGASGLRPGYDVYICGVIKASTLTRKELSHIGLVVLDEAHVCTISALNKVLLNVSPKYLVGLSATPKRSDGMHSALELFFGSSKRFIVRHEVKEYTVYKVQTPFEPKIVKVWRKGKQIKDWITMINSLAYNSKRQDFIVRLILKHPKDHLLVLSNRKLQSQALYDKLLAKGMTSQEVRLLIGNKTLKDKNYRVLIAEVKKASYGFDDPRLSVLILASDITNIEQSEGRIRRHNNIIYDLVDDDNSLELHWKKRETWYNSRGATVKVLTSEDGRTLKEGPTRRYSNATTKKTFIPSKRLI